MDKRVLKTKNGLKDALLALLKEKEFESIKTTEICQKAMISRNSFYNYYSDKYALLEDCFCDYENTLMAHFEEKQKANNPGRGMKQGMMNLATAFLDMENTYQPISILSNFDFTALYYRSMTNILARYEDVYVRTANPSYDLTQLNAFLVLGFWGFIHGNPKLDREDIERRTKKLVEDLTDSPIFQSPHKRFIRDGFQEKTPDPSSSLADSTVKAQKNRTANGENKG